MLQYASGTRQTPIALQFRQIESDDELASIYCLRYIVYCLEKGFLPTEDFPTKKETDKYDEYAAHFVAIDAADGGQLLGYFRLILPNPYGFPCEKHFDLTERSPYPEKTVEMSRLIVAPNARIIWRHILMGLSKEVYLFNRENNIDYCYAAVEESLFSVLKRIGLPFRQIGLSADYMGETLPTILSMVVLEEILPYGNALFYDYLQASREEQETYF